MSSPLMPKTEFDVSDEEVEETRINILQSTASASMVSKMRQNVEERKRALAVVIDENKINSSERLANALVNLDSILLDDEVLFAIKDGIISSKDPAKSYNEFAKASNEIYKRMQQQQLSSADPDASQNKPKSVKIAVVDSTGATMVSIGGDD